MWKKVLAVALAGMAAVTLTACGSSAGSSSSASSAAAAASSAAPAAGDTLVVYFTGSGNTEKAAKTLAAAANANLYQIVPEQPYTSDDLNYNNSDSRVSKEHKDPSIRPAIKGNVNDWDKYKTVFIGYPIWWGQAPAIMYTFVENHNFDGKTVIPFATSASSPIGTSGENLGKAAKTGTWKQGDILSPSESQQDMAKWVQKVTK